MDIDSRIAAVWDAYDQHTEESLAAAMESALAGLPEDSPRVAFERACVLDATGRPAEAIPLYRKALDLGLGGDLRRQAVIQMASSMRNVGEAAQAADLLEAELAAASDELDGAVRAFLALCLADCGREREAVSVALAALVPHLPRYQRSLAHYAAALVDPDLG